MGSSLTEADDEAVMSQLAELEAEQALLSGAGEEKAFEGVSFPVAPVGAPVSAAAAPAEPPKAVSTARVAVPA